MRPDCKHFLGATTMEKKQCSCKKQKTKTIQAVKCRILNIVKDRTCDLCKRFEKK